MQPVKPEDQPIILAVGAVLVGVIVAAGFVVAVLTGVNVDGLAGGFGAIIGFFFGGALSHLSSAAASYRTQTTAVQTAQATTSTAATVLGHSVQPAQSAQSAGPAPSSEG